MSTIEVSTEELVARAAGLREQLHAESDAAEERGGYSPEMHQAFVDAGFYRMLQPRMFGGYEMDLADYFRVIIEIGRGDPQTGWALCLAAGHAFQIGAFFSEPAQTEIFGIEGDVVIPSRAVPGGTATRVDGGWQVDGTWDYCSGATYATHALLLALTPQPAGPPERRMVVLPRSDFEILDDWGGGRTLGLGGTRLELDPRRGEVRPRPPGRDVRLEGLRHARGRDPRLQAPRQPAVHRAVADVLLRRAELHPGRRRALRARRLHGGRARAQDELPAADAALGVGGLPALGGRGGEPDRHLGDRAARQRRSATRPRATAGRTTASRSPSRTTRRCATSARRRASSRGTRWTSCSPPAAPPRPSGARACSAASATR